MDSAIFEKQQKRSRSQPSTTKKLNYYSTIDSQRAPRLIEQTRHLMETTIEYVAQPEFEYRDAIERMEAIRPESIDRPVIMDQTAPGLAFVSGLVEMPLLTAAEERYYFVWMNYLKFRSEQHRRLLDLRRPDLSLIEKITSDLEEAVRIRNRIVQANSRLIVALARKMGRDLEQLSDLISEGMIPLIRAVELFNVSLGNRFSTYATWAVRNQMLRFLKPRTSLIEVGTDSDIASWDSIPDNRANPELVETASTSHANGVRQLVSSLSRREQQVINARFGLNGQPQGQSFADIAAQIGLSKERVRQILQSTLCKMRNKVSCEEFDATE